MRSNVPDLIARISAAHSSNSSRVVAKSRPLGIALIQCPARPIRCKQVAIARGDPIWHTKSMVP
ncbi:MAG TPA: hypothetical protein VFO36_08620, partial [Nitrospiraceae bacterium]|nr:hypothetical protein [Nitrospiraceae bacterium]